jgi:hypothetical protein
MHNNINLRSKNKKKSTWKIINSDMLVPSTVMHKKTITNQCANANIFNNYFSSVDDSVNADNNKIKFLV